MNGDKRYNKNLKNTVEFLIKTTSLCLRRFCFLVVRVKPVSFLGWLIAIQAFPTGKELIPCEKKLLCWHKHFTFMKYTKLHTREVNKCFQEVSTLLLWIHINFVKERFFNCYLPPRGQRQRRDREMVEWSQKSRPKKIPRAKKIPGTKINPPPPPPILQKIPF